MKAAKPKAAAASSSKNSDAKLAVKKGGAKAKAAKDPNKPKRPPSAFFVFMDEFRKQYKEENPSNKSVATVSKAGGEKWRSMSDADKALYAKKADKAKVQYQKNMKAYEKGEGKSAADEAEGEGSDKSKSEVDSGSEEEEEEDD